MLILVEDPPKPVSTMKTVHLKRPIGVYPKGNFQEVCEVLLYP